MTLQCDDAFDALGYGIERIKSLGVPPDGIIAVRKDILKGGVIVVRDLHKELPPVWNIYPPNYAFQSVLSEMA